MDGRTSDSSATADGWYGASANHTIGPAPGSAECFAGAEQFSSPITGQVMGASNVSLRTDLPYTALSYDCVYTEQLRQSAASPVRQDGRLEVYTTHRRMHTTTSSSGERQDLGTPAVRISSA